MATVRRVRFEYPDDMDPIWTPRRPAFSCAANSVSMMMPHIEPYFVRSVGAMAGQVPADLRAETDDYLRQESEHHRQHRFFNRMLVAHYPGLARLESVIAWVYRRLEARRSSRFNLAFAAASETMAYSAARWAAEHRRELFDQADEVVATLFLWHLAEEVEHKSVAFDVHRACFGHRPRARLNYVGAMLVALALVVAFVMAGTTVMLAGERRLHHPLSWFHLVRWSIGFAFELLTNLAVSLFPSHHPSQLVDPGWYEVWLREFDDDSGTLPVWHADRSKVRG